MINKRQLIKSIVYRVYSSLITFLISFILTGDVVISISIGLIDSLVKIFSYYAFDELWNRATGFNPEPAVVLLTGLSGAGKTTIAKTLIDILRKKGVNPVLLDGDEIRKAIHLDGYDENSRKRHNLNVGYMAKLLESQGKIVIVSMISPYEDIRNQIRAMCKKFIEVYVSTDISLCMKRDPKGLYKKALAGEIPDFTGVTAPYFPPKNPELVLDTAMLSPTEASMKIMERLRK